MGRDRRHRAAIAPVVPNSHAKDKEPALQEREPEQAALQPAQPESRKTKHAGGRPRKPGQQRLSLSVTKETLQILRLTAAIDRKTMSEIVDQWAAKSVSGNPALAECLGVARNAGQKEV